MPADTLAPVGPTVHESSRWRARPHGSPRAFAALLVVGSAVGLLAAAVLLVEKMALLRDPAHVPSCSINPVLSCGSIMTTPQAEAFGFPNPLLGVVGFSVVGTIGTALLAGARLPRWFWLGLQSGTTAGVVFVHWLVFQSLYRIGALCPYCMAVWVVTVTLFVAVTGRNGRTGTLGLPGAARVAAFAPSILAGWLTLVSVLIGTRFWDYWSMTIRDGIPPLAWLLGGATLYAAVLGTILAQRRASARCSQAS